MIPPNYKEFAKWAIREGSWKYGGLDGFDIQDMALKHGLMREEKYDPETHGPNDFGVERGAAWFVFIEP